MASAFTLKGIYPATGKLIQTTVVVSSAQEAKERAERAGLVMVVVHPSTEDATAVDTPVTLGTPETRADELK